jgi:hypothetical protein
MKQKLVVRRGNCDPVTAMEAATSTAVPDPLGACRYWGAVRDGLRFMLAGVFQRMAVLPDASGVVFEVTKQFSLYPSLTPEPPRGEGIFFLRADGRGRLRRLGPASRFPPFLFASDPLANFYLPTQYVLPVSPDGRSVALIDLGPDTAGHEAPQIFLLDVRSGRRTQVTRQSRLPNTKELDPAIYFVSFLNRRTLSFGSGIPLLGTLKTYRVETRGSGVPEQLPALTVLPDSRIVAQFAVTGARPGVTLVTFPEERSIEPVPGLTVNELVLIDGKNLVQLTNFGRFDTGFGYASVARGRIFFVASANPPPGENPAGVCQLFSVNKRAGDLRQLTRLPPDGGRSFGCSSKGAWGLPEGCQIDVPYASPIAPDPVTGTVLFGSSCDPVGGNPFGDQLFAMRPDGTGLRQVTAARGREILPDGTLRVETVGPFAYPLGPP